MIQVRTKGMIGSCGRIIKSGHEPSWQWEYKPAKPGSRRAHPRKPVEVSEAQPKAQHKLRYRFSAFALVWRRGVPGLFYWHSASRPPQKDRSESKLCFRPPWRWPRLAALVPKPRVNLTRFHGVFAPNSKHRASVTPAKRGKGAKPKACAEQQESMPVQRRAAMTWAQRLKRVFGIDIETCRACGGAVRIIACIRLQGKDCSYNPIAFPPSMAVRCRR